MASKTNGKDQQSREERLKAALKANMAKRKGQARARRAGGAVEGAEAKAGKDKADG